jgi:hypothetical protein
MAVQRLHKPFTFQDGSQIEIWKPSWDMSMDRSEIEDQARAAKTQANGSGDPMLFFFWEEIYAGLAACSTGDVPDVHKAYQLLQDHPEDIDAWFQLARGVTGWYESGELTEQLVQVNDSTSIKCLSMRPSVVMRRYALDLEVDKQEPLPNIRKEVFRVTYYPKLAGCSVGDVPSMDEARAGWGEDDLQLWYDGAKAVIPEWFLSLEELAQQNQRRAEVISKKKSRPRKK